MPRRTRIRARGIQDDRCPKVVIMHDELDPMLLSPSPKRPLYGARNISNGPSGSHQVIIGGKRMLPDTKERLKGFLCRNLNVFAWRHEDIVGIDPKISCTTQKN